MSTLDFLPSFLPYSAESVSADPSKQGVKFQLKPSDIPGTALGLLLPTRNNWSSQAAAHGRMENDLWKPWGRVCQGLELLRDPR